MMEERVIILIRSRFCKRSVRYLKTELKCKPKQSLSKEEWASWSFLGTGREGFPYGKYGSR